MQWPQQSHWRLDLCTEPSIKSSPVGPTQSFCSLGTQMSAWNQSISRRISFVLQNRCKSWRCYDALGLSVAQARSVELVLGVLSQLSVDLSETEKALHEKSVKNDTLAKSSTLSTSLASKNTEGCACFSLGSRPFIIFTLQCRQFSNSRSSCLVAIISAPALLSFCSWQLLLFLQCWPCSCCSCSCCRSSSPSSYPSCSCSC